MYIVFDHTRFPASPRPVERYMHVNVYVNYYSSCFFNHAHTYTSTIFWFIHLADFHDSSWLMCIVCIVIGQALHAGGPRQSSVTTVDAVKAVTDETPVRSASCAPFPLTPGAHAEPRGTRPGEPVMKPNVRGEIFSLYASVWISGTFVGMPTDVWKQQHMTIIKHESWNLLETTDSFQLHSFIQSWLKPTCTMPCHFAIFVPPILGKIFLW